MGVATVDFDDDEPLEEPYDVSYQISPVPESGIGPIKKLRKAVQDFGNARSLGRIKAARSVTAPVHKTGKAELRPAAQITTKYETEGKTTLDYTIKGGQNGMAAYRAPTVEELADFVLEALPYGMLKLAYQANAFDNKETWSNMKLVTQSGAISAQDNDFAQAVILDGTEVTFDPDHSFSVCLYDMKDHFRRLIYSGSPESAKPNLDSSFPVFPELIEEMLFRGWEPNSGEFNDNKSFHEINRWRKEEHSGWWKTRTRKIITLNTGFDGQRGETIHADHPIAITSASKVGQAELRPATLDEHVAFAQRLIKAGGKFIFKSQCSFDKTRILTACSSGVLRHEKGSQVHIIVPEDVSLDFDGKCYGMFYWMEKGVIQGRNVLGDFFYDENYFPLTADVAARLAQEGHTFKKEDFIELGGTTAKEQLKQVKESIKSGGQKEVGIAAAFRPASTSPIRINGWEFHYRDDSRDGLGQLDVATFGQIDEKERRHGAWQENEGGIIVWRWYEHGDRIAKAADFKALMRKPEVIQRLDDISRTQAAFSLGYELQRATEVLGLPGKDSRTDATVFATPVSQVTPHF